MKRKIRFNWQFALVIVFLGLFGYLLGTLIYEVL